MENHQWVILTAGIVGLILLSLGLVLISSMESPAPDYAWILLWLGILTVLISIFLTGF